MKGFWKGIPWGIGGGYKGMKGARGGEEEAVMGKAIMEKAVAGKDAMGEGVKKAGEGFGRRVFLEDDLDLEKIEKSGQAFRIRRLEEGWYRFLHRDRLLYIRREEGLLEGGGGEKGSSFQVSASKEEWESIWAPYLNLDFSYRSLRQQGEKLHPFLGEACQAGRGLRILKQDPWEMLVTFIISQRKNIPAITQCVEKLSAVYGEVLGEETLPPERGESLYSFPKPEVLSRVGEEELREMGLGYRAPYVCSASRLVSSGELDLKALEELGDEELLEALMQVKGVGVKVANCVALFGYQRYRCAPVDVWIARAIEKEWGGKNPFPELGEYAGIYQQYVFYCMREREGKIKKKGEKGEERG